MDAANTLATLGGGDEMTRKTIPVKTEEDPKTESVVIKTEPADIKTESADTSDANKKRYIPEHKKPDAALTFPEKLMNLMKYAETKEDEEFCVAWLPDGKSFVIRNPDQFTRQVLPKYFKATKFSSFTRKLYRWGFRQVNRGIGPDDPIIFGNEFFQRDKAELMAKMKSVTAASTRKQAEVKTVASLAAFNGKRPYDGNSMFDGLQEPDTKRILLDQLIHQKAACLHGQPLYGNPNAGAMNLATALRPSLAMAVGGGMSLGAGAMKPFDLLNATYPNNGNTLLNSLQLPTAPPAALNAAAPNNNGMARYPSAASTADIVNAAINALRFTS